MVCNNQLFNANPIMMSSTACTGFPPGFVSMGQVEKQDASERGHEQEAETSVRMDVKQEVKQSGALLHFLIRT